MMNWTKGGIAVVVATLLSASAWAGEGPSGHSHGHGQSFSAGEPGNPKKPARIVQVTMGESDGKMLFVPARLEIKKGDQINSCCGTTVSSITNSSWQAPQTISNMPKK